MLGPLGGVCFLDIFNPNTSLINWSFTITASIGTFRDMTTKLDIQNRQREIKHLCNLLQWSVASFASKYLIDTSDYDVDEIDVKRFQNKVKKQLQRESATPMMLSTLDGYLEFIEATDEYNNLVYQQEIPPFQELTGFISDYQLILEDEEDLQVKKVLEVAAAYALSLGPAWDFNVVNLSNDEFDKRHLVIWEGSMGDYGGSGTWGPSMCEVVESFGGNMYVEPSPDRWFKTSLRCISRVIGYRNGELILQGYRYDDQDANNYPSLEYKISLKRVKEGVWELTSETFLEKIF